MGTANVVRCLGCGLSRLTVELNEEQTGWVLALAEFQGVEPREVVGEIVKGHFRSDKQGAQTTVGGASVDKQKALRGCAPAGVMPSFFGAPQRHTFFKIRWLTLQGENLMETTQPSTTAGASLGETPQKIDPKEIISAALKLAKKTGEPVNFCHEDLGGANLREADLSGANLGYTNLMGADLGYTNLRGATLRGADLSGANLREANLMGANLGGADLSGACLSRAKLTKLKWYDLECELIGFSQYPLFAVQTKDGLHFDAGCRAGLTETKALKHWGERLKSSYLDEQIRAQAFIWAIKNYVQKTKEKA